MPTNANAASFSALVFLSLLEEQRTNTPPRRKWSVAHALYFASVLTVARIGGLLTCIEEEDELVHEPGHARHAHLQREHQQPHEPD
jgi:hypothetical protein